MLPVCPLTRETPVRVGAAYVNIWPASTIFTPYIPIYLNPCCLSGCWVLCEIIQAKTSELAPIEGWETEAGWGADGANWEEGSENSASRPYVYIGRIYTD